MTKRANLATVTFSGFLLHYSISISYIHSNYCGVICDEVFMILQEKPALCPLTSTLWTKEASLLCKVPHPWCFITVTENKLTEVADYIELFSFYQTRNLVPSWKRDEGVCSGVIVKKTTPSWTKLPAWNTQVLLWTLQAALRIIRILKNTKRMCFDGYSVLCFIMTFHDIME